MAPSSESETRTDLDPVECSLKLLREALSIVDAEGWPAEIGARLDHVICSMEDLKQRAERSEGTR